MSGDLLDIAGPDEVYILRTGVELYLARCVADQNAALEVGSEVAAEYWDQRIGAAQALLDRLGGPVPELDPQPSAFVRRPATVIHGRRDRLTCDDDDA